MSNVDYTVFDRFLRVDTWQSSHPLDDKRFFLCLHKVVEDPDFSAEAMGDYMRGAKGVDSYEHYLAQRIRDLVGKAWAVRDYLQAVTEKSAYEDPDVLI
jgi:hypothetical protein